jgi:lipoyl-dependent peroxiredoxin
MKFKRRSRAAWQGGVEDGGGTINLGSGAFEGTYSLRARVEESPETNPEEPRPTPAASRCRSPTS